MEKGISMTDNVTIIPASHQCWMWSNAPMARFWLCLNSFGTFVRLQGIRESPRKQRNKFENGHMRILMGCFVMNC